MHIGEIALAAPDRLAVIVGNGGPCITYREMNDESTRLAKLWRQLGLKRGDHVAVLLENRPEYFIAIWAALRSGLYVTPINWHLGADEAGYIVEDCGAQVLITSQHHPQLLDHMAPHLTKVEHCFSVDGGFGRFAPLSDALTGIDAGPLENESEGNLMYYSSGTTGRPKGIKHPLRDVPFGSPVALALLLSGLYGVNEESRYLSPAPLYHAAPSSFSTAAHRLGATVVIMDHFDPESVLATIDHDRVTHAQFVPTHFVRMLRLNDNVKNSYDLSSLKVAIHAAAPCPVEVKRQMIEWWGPIVYEYYAGSEGIGFCAVGPDEWMANPGTVGRPVSGAIHITDDDGNELPVGQAGIVWFDNNAVFEYHNDADKTSSAFNHQGWSTLGDIGYVNDDGYLFLTDRASHMIISGGVNIYPQEVENILAVHPAVADVAVIGVPDEEFGESVLGVVQLLDGVAPSDELANELVRYCRERLSSFKCPRRIVFDPDLPRLPTGKLVKRQIRERYATAPNT